MIFQADKNITTRREQILCTACADIAAELKLIEPEAFFMFFQFGQMPEIHDVVMATLDRNFQNNTMNFACTGETVISWNKASSVAIDLEFVSEGIFAFFRLFLSANEPLVELHHISFQESAGDPGKNTTHLVEVLELARTPR